MSYRELIAELAREHAEEFSDALLELGALSVSVEDADADTPDEQPLFGEPGLTPDRTAWQRSRVIALLAPEHEPAVLLTAAANELGLDPAPSFTVSRNLNSIRFQSASASGSCLHGTMHRTLTHSCWNSILASHSAPAAIPLHVCVWNGWSNR
jgi:ribosomal protein L11 methylase PrmA